MDDEAEGEKTLICVGGGLRTGVKRAVGFCGVRRSDISRKGDDSTDGGVRSWGGGVEDGRADGRGIAVEKLSGVL